MAASHVEEYVGKFVTLFQRLYFATPDDEYKETIREILTERWYMGPKRLDAVLLILKITKTKTITTYLTSVCNMWNFSPDMTPVEYSIESLNAVIRSELETAKQKFIQKLNVYNRNVNSEVLTLFRLMQHIAVQKFELDVRSQYQIYNNIYNLIMRRDYRNMCIDICNRYKRDIDNTNIVVFPVIKIQVPVTTFEVTYNLLDKNMNVVSKTFAHTNSTNEVVMHTSYNYEPFKIGAIDLIKVNSVLGMYNVEDVVDAAHFDRLIQRREEGDMKAKRRQLP